MAFTDILTNLTTTQNGAVAFKSTESKVLDLFANGAVADIQEQIELIGNALDENPLLATKVALYSRDVRNGLGRRDIFSSLVTLLIYLKEFKLLKLIFKHTPEVGSWKDLIKLIGLHEKTDKYIFKLIAKHIDENTLLCKWLPRQGDVAKAIFEGMNTYTGSSWHHGSYRRHIAHMSKTVEQQMCANQWDDIDYKSVPSLANRKYSNAFMRRDEERRTKFLEDAVEGKVTMNSSVLYPHQIARLASSDAATANALWVNLPNYMETAVNVLPIIDLSYSMTTDAIGTEGSCMDAAIGLGLYFSEHNTGSYKDVWMNFSSTPQAYKLQGDTLSQRISNLDRDNWGGSTDINAALQLVLSAAKRDPQDAPEMILIVSDMEFNRASGMNTNFEEMKALFKEEGITFPKIVFWRLDVKSGSNPVTQHTSGAILVNGYSINLLNSILKLDITNFDPYTAMLETVKDMYTWLDE